MKRSLPALVMAALLASAPVPAHAFLGGLIDAGADVLTFGEHGRKRDAERARAEAEKQQQLAAQAAANRLRLVAEKKERRAAITASLNDLTYFEESLGSLEKNTTHLVELAKLELRSRSALKSSILPTLKKLVGMNSSHADELLLVMKDLAAEALQAPVNSGNPEADLDANRASFRRTQDAIERLENVARANNMEVSQLIKQAVAEAGKQEAEAILTALVSTEGNIKALREYAASRREQTKGQLTIVDKELTEMGEAPPVVTSMENIKAVFEALGNIGTIANIIR